MMLVLKLPLGALLYIVWWAIKSTPEVEGSDEGGGAKRWPHGPRPPRTPHPPPPRPARRAASAVSRAHPQRRRAGPRHAAQLTRTVDSRAMQSVLSDGTIRRLVRGGADQDRSVGSGDDPAGLDRPAPRRVVPRVPQPPRAGDRPARSAAQPHRADRPRPGRAVHRAPRRVRPGADGGARRAARRRRRPHRGQELARPPRAHRPRDRRLRRPGVRGHAHARGHQPHPHPDRAVAGAADRPAVVHGARRARGAALRSPDLGSHYHGQVEATESRYEGGPARGGAAR